MINVVEIPIRADDKMSYSVYDDILTISVNEHTETFDFTGLPEGEVGLIEYENIPSDLDLIASAKKVGDVVTIELRKLYSFEEKHLYETGEEMSSPFGGGLIV